MKKTYNVRKKEKLTKWKLFLSYSLLCILFSSAINAQTLIWQDEFDGTEIDRSIWTNEVGDHGFGNGELEFYTDRPENSYIENGNLVIRALNDNYLGSDFTSARLVTFGKFAFKYGTLEARIKLPQVANGLWPAFWLLGNNYGVDGWPKCSEIDIMESGYSDFLADGTANSNVSSAVHWWHEDGTWSDWLHAQHSTDTTISENFYDDYHIFKLFWDETYIKIYLDDAAEPFYSIEITDSNLSEFHNPSHILLNLAVGGSNFVGITDPSQITAPLPAEMQIDYIRLYDNGSTELYYTDVEEGNFGIYTENTSVNKSLDFSDDANLWIWNNMNTGSSSPAEGSEVLSYSIDAGDWFGMGIITMDKNMQNFSGGYLNFNMKVSSSYTSNIGIGIESTLTGSGASQGWIDLENSGEQYGLVRDGEWHEVSVPLNIFRDIDFTTIKHMFMVKGDAPSSAIELAIDDIYWSESVERPTPENGNFGVYTETENVVDNFDLGTDGDFYIWENTLEANTQSPFEGASSLSYSSASGQSWFGMAFSPSISYDLTAFRYDDSYLHFAMKTSSSTTFYIGMKSGSIDNAGQKWIKFENGNDPYGFVRNGQWHEINIPMTDISDVVDLSEVSQLFEMFGIDGAIEDFEIDDIYFSGGGNALNDSIETPILSALSINPADITIKVGNTVQCTATGYDQNGDVYAINEAWSVNGGGSITSEGLFTAKTPGTYKIIATAEGVSDTATITITELILSTLNINPKDTIIEVGNTVQYTATGHDQNGDVYAISEAWSVNGGGTITSVGLFTATTAGTYIVTATAEGIDATATLTIKEQVVYENIALNKPISASTEENGGTLANNANDGDYNTRWSSEWLDPQYIIVDLEDTYDIKSVVLNWETAFGSGYEVQVSSDGNTWETLYTETAGDGGWDTLNVNGTGRYVKIYGTTRGTGWGYSLFELEVYGSLGEVPVLTTISVSPSNASVEVGNTLQFTATGYDQNGDVYTINEAWSISGGGSISTEGVLTATTAGSYIVTATEGGVDGTASFTVTEIPTNDNLALNKPISASSEQNGVLAVNANDGDFNTRWSSEWADPQYIVVDLENTCDITSVVLYWETAYGSEYEVQISTDGNNWETLYTEIAGDGGEDIINVNGTGRYVRIYGTARGTGWGYSLYEFEVYGSTAKSSKMEEASITTLITKPVVKLYPNPVSEVLNLKSSDTIKTIKISDILGKAVLYKELSGDDNDTSLNLSSLKKGVYLIEIRTNNNVPSVDTFIKK